MTVASIAERPQSKAKIFKMLPARADIIPNGEIILPAIWKRLHDEGTWEMFFHDCPDLTFGQFVAALSRPEELVHAVCEMDSDKEDAQVLDVAGIAMVTDIRVTEKVRRGLGNFIVMQKYWGEDSERVGKTILDGWFGDFTVIAGLTPASNDRALRFVQHMGFQITGRLPQFVSYRGELCDAVVTAQTRHEWLDRREELTQ